MGAGTGGWLGGGNKWARQCYGRGPQSMTMVPDRNYYSGVKVSCEEMAELERSFGVDHKKMHDAGGGAGRPLRSGDGARRAYRRSRSSAAVKRTTRTRGDSSRNREASARSTNTFRLRAHLRLRGRRGGVSRDGLSHDGIANLAFGLALMAPSAVTIAAGLVVMWERSKLVLCR